MTTTSNMQRKILFPCFQKLSIGSNMEYQLHEEMEDKREYKADCLLCTKHPGAEKKIYCKNKNEETVEDIINIHIIFFRVKDKIFFNLFTQTIFLSHTMSTLVWHSWQLQLPSHHPTCHCHNLLSVQSIPLLSAPHFPSALKTYSFQVICTVLSSTLQFSLSLAMFLSTSNPSKLTTEMPENRFRITHIFFISSAKFCIFRLCYSICSPFYH